MVESPAAAARAGTSEVVCVTGSFCLGRDRGAARLYMIPFEAICISMLVQVHTR